MNRTLLLIVLVTVVAALVFAGWSWCGQHKMSPNAAPIGQQAMFDGADGWSWGD